MTWQVNRDLPGKVTEMQIAQNKELKPNFTSCSLECEERWYVVWVMHISSLFSSHTFSRL